MSYRILIAGGLSAALATVAIAGGHGGNPAVKARQSHMQLYQHNLAVLGGMAQGEIEYDAEAAQIHADNLLAVASLDERGYWTEGTAAGEVEGSRALPAIWEDMAGFEEDKADMITAASAMAEAAGTGLEAVQANIRAVGQACGACHQGYRQRN